MCSIEREVKEEGGGGMRRERGVLEAAFFRPLVEQPLDCRTMALYLIHRLVGEPAHLTPFSPPSSMDSGADSAPIWSALLPDGGAHCAIVTILPPSPSIRDPTSLSSD